MLASCFSADELGQLLSEDAERRVICDGLPRRDVSALRFAGEVIGALSRAGLLHDGFIQRCAQARPARAEELWRAWRAHEGLAGGRLPSAEEIGAGSLEPEANPCLGPLPERVEGLLNPYGRLHSDQIKALLALSVLTVGAWTVRRLAEWVGVDRMSVTVDTELGRRTLEFGYQVEPMHGTFNMVGAPVLIGWVYVCVFLMAYVLWSLSRRGQLVVLGEPTADPLALLSARFRRFARHFHPPLYALVLALVFAPALLPGGTRWLGWWQPEAYARLQQAPGPELCDRRQWGGPPAGCHQGWVEARVVAANVPDPSRPGWIWRYRLFFGAALALQAFVVLHVAGLASRIAYFFTQVLPAVGPAPTRGRRALAMRLDFADHRRRFGLQELDWVHLVTALSALGVAACWAILTWSNREKGSAYHQTHDLRLCGQLVLWLVGVLGLCGATLGPLILLRFRLRTAQRDHLERLKRLGIGPSDLGYRVADAQDPWPITVRWLVVLAMVLFGLLFVTVWLGAGALVGVRA